jgi:uncharacterized protein YbjT (DUF2867 family)
MPGPLILVTGATGTVGREVVKQLIEGGHAVRALVRDPSNAALGDAVEIVQADLARPETLAPAFDGVDRAFVLSRGANPRLEINAFEAARSANVRHIVKLSGRGIDGYYAGNVIADGHIEAEARLRELGVAWTAIRPSFFATNFLTDFPIATGELRLPAGDGTDCPVDPRDIATVVVEALTAPGHEGKVYEITGPELLTYGEMIETISATTGRPLSYVDVPEVEFREMLSAVGVPDPVVRAILQSFLAVKKGELSTTQTFADLNGRQPHTFKEWARANAAALREQASSSTTQ